MKCIEIYFRHTLIILFLSLVICGCPSSDGGGEDRGMAPKISNLKTYFYVSADEDIWVEKDSFFIGDLFTWKCWVTDTDLDALFWYYTFYKKKNDVYEFYDGPTIGSLETQSDESVYYYPLNPLEIEFPPGEYEFEIQIQDKKGNMSNKYKVPIVINNKILSTGLKIFVTNTGHPGDFLNDPFLGGVNAIEKADSFCNEDSNKPNDSLYKALLVDGTLRDAVTLTDWVLQPSTTYYQSYNNIEIGTTTDDAILATLYKNLTNAIDPLCFDGPDSCLAWTGIGNSGDFKVEDDCNDWSSSTGYGYSGQPQDTNQWAFSWGRAGCVGTSVRLYCVEQP